LSGWNLQDSGVWFWMLSLFPAWAVSASISKWRKTAVNGRIPRASTSIAAFFRRDDAEAGAFWQFPDRWRTASLQPKFSEGRAIGVLDWSDVAMLLVARHEFCRAAQDKDAG
jgi:hypothetical protein